LVNQVLLNKKYKKDIIDRKRIKIILKNISKKSKQKKIDQIVTKKIWSSMIKAFIDYEFRNFKKK
jgi:chorismate mutase